MATVCIYGGKWGSEKIAVYARREYEEIDSFYHDGTFMTVMTNFIFWLFQCHIYIYGIDYFREQLICNKEYYDVMPCFSRFYYNIVFINFLSSAY